MICSQHQPCDCRACDSRNAPLQGHKGIGATADMFRCKFIGQGWDNRCLHHLPHSKNQWADAECNSRNNQWQEWRYTTKSQEHDQMIPIEISALYYEKRPSTRMTNGCSEKIAIVFTPKIRPSHFGESPKYSVAKIGIPA